MTHDFDWDLEGDFVGDLDGELNGQLYEDSKGDFKKDLEGDLQQQFYSYEPDSEVWWIVFIIQSLLYFRFLFLGCMNSGIINEFYTYLTLFISIIL